MTISINGINQSVPSKEDYGRAVQDITALKLIGPSERFDRQHVYVEDETRPYYFDLQSVSAESLPDIVQPGDAPAAGRWIRLPPEGGGVPALHAASHTDGSDQIAAVTGAVNGLMVAADKSKLDGIAALADVTGANAPQAHALSHKGGGSDEIAAVTGALNGLMTSADKTKLDGVAALADVTGDNPPQAHKASHEDGGSDELPVASLAEAAAPGNNTSQALRPDGAGGVFFADVDHNDLISVSINDHHDRDHALGGAEHTADTLANLNGKISDAELDEFHQFFADQLDNPVNADWAVNALAPVVADSNNNGLPVRAFDDTTEEGVGFILRVPSGATNIKLAFKGRAETGPPAARTVGLKLYQRGIPNDAAAEAWSAGTVLTDIDIPTTNEFFQYDTQTITLASLGITAGEMTQFELTRIDPAGGTELVGDWDLLQLEVGFS